MATDQLDAAQEGPSADPTVAADAIVTDRLTKFYGEKCVVNALSIRVPKGSVYGLLGRNGAGKSTAIRMMMGMVQAESGRVTLLGEDAFDLPPETKARIAYLAEGHPLYRGMRIGQAARFTRAFYPTWDHELFEQILDHFELSHKAKIRTLSRGQRAQVSLALAVAPDPELLILDDPTLGLDTVVRRDFLESLIKIIQRRGRTILFCSHILGDVERVADRIGIMVGGVLRAECPTDYFKESVKKIVLEFDQDAPECPPCDGLVHCRRWGSRLELVVAGYGERHDALAESLAPARIEVLELNLEDAFIEYTRGPRRAAPRFFKEDADG